MNKGRFGAPASNKALNEVKEETRWLDTRLDKVEHVLKASGLSGFGQLQGEDRFSSTSRQLIGMIQLAKQLISAVKTVDKFVEREGTAGIVKEVLEMLTPEDKKIYDILEGIKVLESDPHSLEALFGELSPPLGADDRAPHLGRTIPERQKVSASSVMSIEEEEDEQDEEADGSRPLKRKRATADGEAGPSHGKATKASQKQPSGPAYRPRQETDPVAAKERRDAIAPGKASKQDAEHAAAVFRRDERMREAAAKQLVQRQRALCKRAEKVAQLLRSGKLPINAVTNVTLTLGEVLTLHKVDHMNVEDAGMVRFVGMLSQLPDHEIEQRERILSAMDALIQHGQGLAGEHAAAKK